MLRGCLAWLLVAASMAGADAVVGIHPSTIVGGPRATLGEVATITADPETAARLAAIQVAELATLTPVTIDAGLVRALAARTAAPALLRIEGSGTVVRRSRSFSSDEIAAAAASSLPTDATWELVRVSGSIVVPDGAGLRLAAEPIDAAATGEIPFRVRAFDGETERGRALVVLRVARWADMLVAARDLVHGQPVGPGDLRLERRRVDRMNRAAVGADPAGLSGRIAVRDLPAGAVVLPDALSIAPVVRAGSPVTAVWTGKGFTIELDATALADARHGERLGIRRRSDGTVLHAVAQADGTVVIER